MKLTSLIFISFLGWSSALLAQDAETKLKEKGILLTPPSSPVANYVNAVRVGNLLYLAGKGPQKADNTYITGKVGKDLTIDQGYEAAHLTAIAHLAVLQNE
jgi:enamine deaminase RidA (YjgF/YER057c/UK114 family)